MKLQKWQRNAIVDAVVAGGLNALECVFVYDDAEASVTHGPSQPYFRLEGHAGSYKTTTAVGEAAPWAVNAYTWSTVPERVQRWASEVKEDVNTPDLWAEVTRQRQILTGARYDNIQNTQFTLAERSQISEQIEQLKEVVKQTSSLSEAQMQSLTTKLDDLATASGHVGRKDWQLMFDGVLYATIVADLVPPEVLRGMFTIAIHAFNAAVGGGVLTP